MNLHGSQLYLTLLLLSACYVDAQQGFFREELFPEQLQQQQLQVHTQVLQDQLQELNIEWQRNPARAGEILKRRDELLKELQDSQLLQQELQRRLQMRLSNLPLDPFSFPSSPTTSVAPTPSTAQNGFNPALVGSENEDDLRGPRPNNQNRRRGRPKKNKKQPGGFDPNLQQQFDPNQQQFGGPEAFIRPPPGGFSDGGAQAGFTADGSFAPIAGGGNGLGFQSQQPQFVTRRPRCLTASGEKGRCKPLAQCVTFYADVPELRRQPCPLNEVEIGVCCPKKRRQAPPPRPNQPANGVLQAPPPPPVVIPPLTRAELNSAGQIALQRLEERLQFIAQLFASQIFLPDGTPASTHGQFFKPTNESTIQGEIAQKTVEASVNLVNDFNLTPDQGRFALPTFSVLNTVIADTCPPRPNCQLQKYRLPDGSCNNLENERWGKASTALQRILPPKYEDGVNAPRSKAANGQDLPSSRLVSTVFATDANQPHDNLTLFVMQWGQFLDHDLTHTPIAKGQGGTGITCCKDGGLIPPRERHPDCFPIGISRQDHIFAPFGERCMEFTRSLPAPRPECNFGPREQMNQITGYMDGSNIYGSSLDSQRSLREFQGGRLVVQNVGRKSLLPDNKDECSNEVAQSCFRAGDTRVNEQVNLVVMHTLWMREHNRVVGELARLNPGWSDEALFQEGRRIVVAEMQHITYNEWLPIILGNEYMEKFQLAPKEEGLTKLYDPTVNPSITNVFATAAFRFGHSLVAHNLQGVNRFGQVKENLILHNHHFAPFILYGEGAIDNFVRGLSTQSSQKFDRHFTKEITDHLFQGDLDFGLDLVSLNIQRGRDHGLPPYNDWREVCGLPKVRSWEELAQVLDPESVNSLRRLYPSVDEIDLFPAAMAEKSAPGALLGPTFVCLVGDQFSRLRRGDRFFYEESGQPSSFTPEQMSQIKNANLARILCDNSDDLAVMQPLSFFRSSVVNQRVDCRSESILRMDLSPWQREQPQA